MLRFTFAGHRDIYDISAEEIAEVLEDFLGMTEDKTECLVGGMGNFDRICTAAVQMLKKKYPNREITLILVLPYMQKQILTEKGLLSENL